MPDDLTESEFWSQTLSHLGRLDDLATIAVYCLACIAAGVSFQVILYAARNKNFWGCVLLSALCNPAVVRAELLGDIGNVQVTSFAMVNGYPRFWGTCTAVGSNSHATKICNFEVWLSCQNNNVVFGLVNQVIDVADAGNSGGFGIQDLRLGGLFYPFFAPIVGVEWQCGLAYGVSCGTIDGSNVGFNCCGSGQYGATYYVGKDANGCDVLACQSGNCHSCPTAPSAHEGDACPCGSGQTGNGVITLVYNGDGCPVSTTCDGCQACPEVDSGAIGQSCEIDGLAGAYVLVEGQDGCPTLNCDVEAGDPCADDLNEDDIPDYLAGNILAGAQTGSACTCEGGQRDGGKVVYKDNDDGCPVPSCECSCTAGDADNDGCCDDEDPDPQDNQTGCESCNSQIMALYAATLAQLTESINLPSGSVGNMDWNFEFDLGVRSISEGVTPMGIVFGGNLTTGQFHIGADDGSVWDDVFAEAVNYRSTIRTILAACCYLTFSFSTLSALFNPAR